MCLLGVWVYFNRWRPTDWCVNSTGAWEKRTEAKQVRQRGFLWREIHNDVKQGTIFAIHHILTEQQNAIASEKLSSIDFNPAASQLSINFSTNLCCSENRMLPVSYCRPKFPLQVRFFFFLWRETHKDWRDASLAAAICPTAVNLV